MADRQYYHRNEDEKVIPAQILRNVSTSKEFQTDSSHGNASKHPADDIDLYSTTLVEVDVWVERSHCVSELQVVLCSHHPIRITLFRYGNERETDLS